MNKNKHACTFLLFLDAIEVLYFIFIISILPSCFTITHCDTGSEARKTTHVRRKVTILVD